MQSDPAHGDEKLVEAVARALYEHWQFAAQVPWVAGGNSVMQDKARDFGRAALAVARPAILEECARVAEETVAYSSGQAVIRQNIASAIRAME